jgi:hypothetical protein
MCPLIKDQDEPGNKDSSEGLPSFYFLMIFRNFARGKYFGVQYVWEEDNFFFGG